LDRPVAKRSVGEDTERDAGLRVDPEKRAAAAEVAERCGRVPRAGPVRRLRVAELEAEPPVVGALPAEAGQNAVEPGELDRASLVERLAGDPRRRLKLTCERRERASRPADAGAGRALEPQTISPPDVVEVGGERHLGALLDERGRDLEPVVRVDPAAARRRDRRARRAPEARHARPHATA